MATYYVSNAGSDANNGLSTGLPFLTVAKLQAMLAVNDTGLLRRGDRWKETLTVPANGITIDTYGAAAVYDAASYCTNAPIIDGGEYITGWSAYAGGISDSYVTDDFTGTSGNNITTSTFEQGVGPWSLVNGFANPVVFSSDGCARRGNATVMSQHAAANAALTSADQYASANVRVKTLLSVDTALLLLRQNPSGQGYGNFIYAGLVTSAGTNVMRTGWFIGNTNTFFDTTITLAAATDYLLRVEAQGTVVRSYLNGVLIDTRDFAGTFMGTFQQGPGLPGFRLGSTSAPVGADTTGMQLIDYDAGPLGAPGTPVNTYQATLGTDPMIVDLRGAYSPPGIGVNLLADGTYFYKGGKIYLRSNAGIPSNTDVVGGFRNYGITSLGKTNTTIRGVAFEHCRDHSVNITSGGSGALLSQCMAQRSSGGAAANGVFAFASHATPVIDSCVLRDCGSDAIYMSSPCHDYRVTNNRLGRVDGPNADCFQYDGTGGDVANGLVSGNVMYGPNLSPKGCVIIFGDNHTIENNYFEGGTNFHIACVGSHHVIRNNVFYNCRASIPGTGGAFEITDNSATAWTDYIVHHNVFIDCNPAINVWSAGTANRSALLFYANTIVNSAVVPTNGQVVFAQAISGEFKDNIIWNASGSGQSYKVTSLIGGAWVSDYNLIGPEAASFINFTATLYSTLAAYVAGKSQDAHSIKANPLFVNLGGIAKDGTDYRPTASSPAVGAGTLISGFVVVPNIGALDPPLIIRQPTNLLLDDNTINAVLDATRVGSLSLDSRSTDLVLSLDNT